MRHISVGNFGLVIAYLLPGFVALWGVGLFSGPVQIWMFSSPSGQPTVGGFLYVTLGSLAAGLVVSAIRWAVIDTVHHATGLREPPWDFAQLQRHFEAFEGLVENHYRYHQHYANMLVALSFTYLVWRSQGPAGDGGIDGIDVAYLLIVAVLFLGSRDSLAKYYARTAQLLAGNR